MTSLVVASLVFVAGFAALLHALALVCLAPKRSLPSYTYLSLAVLTMAYALYAAGGDRAWDAARWVGLVIPLTSVSLALVFWIVPLLDWRRRNAGGAVLVKLESPEERSTWLRAQVLLVAFWVVYIASDFPWRAFSADNPSASSEPWAQVALGLTATVGFVLAMSLSGWIYIFQLRPLALLERGLWLHGARSGRLLNQEQKRFVPWDDVVSYGWKDDRPTALEIKTANWTGAEELHFLSVPTEKRSTVEEILRRFVPSRNAA